MTDSQTHILIIKLGALGDFVQALGPMKALRDHHADAHITLLTTAPYVDFAKASGYVDEIWTDTRPKAWHIKRILNLRKKLSTGNFSRVYDLQTSSRSSGYFKLFVKKPEWSGIAPACSHPHANPDRDRMHTLDRQAEQLSQAGIASVPAPDVSWANTDVSAFNLPEAFVLLVPGGAAHRTGKRWSADRYGDLAQRLVADGVTPVLLGTHTERPELDRIKALCPQAVDLADKTSFLDIATLARRARGAVGNDTGPMHLIAASGCKSVVLYSHASNPDLCAQRGPDVTIIREAQLTDIPVDRVCDALGAATP